MDHTYVIPEPLFEVTVEMEVESDNESDHGWPEPIKPTQLETQSKVQFEPQPSTSSGIPAVPVVSLVSDLQPADTEQMQKYVNTMSERTLNVILSTSCFFMRKLPLVVSIISLMARGNFIYAGRSDGRVSKFKPELLELVEDFNFNLTIQAPVSSLINFGQNFFAIAGLCVVRFIPLLKTIRVFPFSSGIVGFSHTKNHIIIVERRGTINIAKRNLFNITQVKTSKEILGQIDKAILLQTPEDRITVVTTEATEKPPKTNFDYYLFIHRQNEYAVVVIAVIDNKPLLSINNVKCVEKGLFETKAQEYQLEIYDRKIFYAAIEPEKSRKGSNVIKIKLIDELKTNPKGRDVETHFGLIESFKIENEKLIILTKDWFIEILIAESLTRYMLISLKENLDDYIIKYIKISSYMVASGSLYIGTRDGRIIALNADPKDDDYVCTRCYSLFGIAQITRIYKKHICAHFIPSTGSNPSQEILFKRREKRRLEKMETTEK